MDNDTSSEDYMAEKKRGDSHLGRVASEFRQQRHDMVFFSSFSSILYKVLQRYFGLPEGTEALQKANQQEQNYSSHKVTQLIKDDT